MKKIVNTLCMLFCLLMLNAGVRVDGALTPLMSPLQDDFVYQHATVICKFFVEQCCDSTVKSDCSFWVVGFRGSAKKLKDTVRRDFLNNHCTYTRSIIRRSQKNEPTFMSMVGRLRDQVVSKEPSHMFFRSVVLALNMLFSAEKIKKDFIAVHGNHVKDVIEIFFTVVNGGVFHFAAAETACIEQIILLLTDRSAQASVPVAPSMSCSAAVAQERPLLPSIITELPVAIESLSTDHSSDQDSVTSDAAASVASTDLSLSSSNSESDVTDAIPISDEPVSSTALAITPAVAFPLAQAVAVALCAAGSYALDSAMQTVVASHKTALEIPSFAPEYNVQVADVFNLETMATRLRYALIAAWGAALGRYILRTYYSRT
jgi:hypothetical protein